MFRKLDDVDHKILRILSEDSRTAFTDVGRRLGISDATVHVRVKKMMAEGVIKSFTVEADEAAYGGRVSGFLLLNVKPGATEEVAKQLAENEQVDAVYEIHGSNDLTLKIKAGDLEELRDVVLKIRETPNVVNSELKPVLKTWKEA